ncbi:MAG: protealysin inhibitor emfourin, partial [Chloroflexota bacterium]
DLDRLTAHEADHLLLLIDKARFFDLPTDCTAPSNAEEFAYEITVRTDTKRHTVCFSESAVPEALQPLFEELSTMAIVV